jgi:hypothetical protein
MEFDLVCRFGQGEPVIFIHGGKGSSNCGASGSCGGTPLSGVVLDNYGQGRTAE